MVSASHQLLLWSTLALVSVVLASDSADYVNEHNAWRAEVGAPPLVWDTDLADLAQDWANWVRDNNECNLQHSSTLGTEYPGGTQGENLYWAWTSGTNLDKTVIDAVLSWGREKPDYKYGPVGDDCTQPNGPTKPVGHYTAMTWTDTRYVGCAQAQCNPSGGGTSGIWVCRYFPAGNIQNQYPFCGKNVPDGMEKCDTLLPGGRPDCGTPCGSCESSATPASCSATIDPVCLTDVGTGWSCSGATCEVDENATPLGGSSQAAALRSAWVAAILPVLAALFMQ